MLIAVDASTVATGYAFGGPQDAGPRGGVWRLPGAEETVFDRTLGEISRSVMELTRLLKPRAIYLEAPFSKIDREHSEATAIALMQLAGAVRAAAAQVQCRLVLCAVFNVRKTFVGTGYLSRAEAKPRVMERCSALGWSIINNEGKPDDNIADAFATWAYGMTMEYPGWKPNQPQLFDQARARA